VPETAPDPPIFTANDALPERPEPAVLLVDKPKGLTSFDVIRRLRRRFGIKKMGHAGTLDPMATGLLIVLIGREATRLQDRFMGLPKIYTGTIRMGETTPSFDAESEVIERRNASSVTDEDLERARSGLEGEILQLPPMYSAVKVGGERLYAKARRGEEIERQRRPVTIYRFELTGRRGNDLDFEVECSKGTYIRTLAHDLGQVLGVGGHLTALRRTGIGPFDVEEAWTLEQLTEN
jgi:tRNA pseudouridine55 synthase